MVRSARIRSLLVAMAAVLACGACTDDAGSQGEAAARSSSTSSSSRTPASPGDVPPAPRIGDCRNTPDRELDPASDWVDDTPVVDCSRVHTLETVEIIHPAEELTRSLVRQLAATCDGDRAATYLGITHHGVGALAYPLVFWPSPAQRAAGQSWVRCDLGMRATTRCCRHLARITGSLRGAFTADPARFQICTDELPDPARNQPLTSCEKPHRSQVLTTPFQLDVTRYPPAAVLRAKGRSGCTRLAARHDDPHGLVVTPGWETQAVWSKAGGPVFAWCWIHRPSGLLPPVG